MNAHSHLIQEIRESAIPLTDHHNDFKPLLDMIGDARFVLIGEATHGTEEFYRLRAKLSQELILNHGFNAIAVEGDWPDCYRANRFVRGDDTIANATQALNGFQRFPTWMWRNHAVVEFLDWLRDHNAKKTPQEMVGFYGLDLYSLHASINAVIDYLDEVDPDAALRARDHYGCFDHYDSGDPQRYGYAASFGVTPTCERAVIQELVALHRRQAEYLKRDGYASGEAFFCAEQNAKTVVDAEAYYRTMFQGHVASWNLRDKHMADTLEALVEHLAQHANRPAKVVVWAHNSHIGDARATEMGMKGEWNLGQLIREAHGAETRLIGFSTYQGTVTAASKWDGLVQQKTVRPGIKESYENLFHEIGISNFMLIFGENQTLDDHLNISRLQRAIGVLYRPETERASHYFFAKLREQFNAIIHIDTSQALRPLDTTALWHKGEVFETYPTGM